MSVAAATSTVDVAVDPAPAPEPAAVKKTGVKTNVAFAWAAQVSAAVAGILLMPLIFERVGQTVQGTWLLLNATAGYARLLYLGFGETTARYVSLHAARREWADLNRVGSCVHAVYLGSATLVVSVAAVLSWLVPYLNDWGEIPVWELRVATLLLGLNMAIGLAGSVYGGVLMGVQRFDLERGTQIAITVLRVALVVLFLGSEHGLVTLALVFTAVTLVENGLFWWFAHRNVPTLKLTAHDLDRATVRKCFAFSSFAALGVISEILIFTTDTVVIGFTLSAAATLPYVMANRVSEMLRRPLEQLGVVVLPKAGELDAAGDKAGELRRLIVESFALVFLLTCGFFIGSVFFGDLFLKTWMGPGWGVSHAIMILLVAALTIAMPVGLLRRVLIGVGEVRVPSALLLAEAVLNLGLSLWLVRVSGLYGVALGTLIPVAVIEIFVLLPFASRRLSIPTMDLVEETARRCAVPILALTAFCAAVDRLPLAANWATLLAVTAGGGVVLLTTRFGFAVLTNPKAVLRGRAG